MAGTMAIETRAAFIAGWSYGAYHAAGPELTTREVEALFPGLDAGVFVQGMLDGRAGDVFRLELCREKSARAALRPCPACGVPCDPTYIPPPRVPLSVRCACCCQ